MSYGTRARASAGALALLTALGGCGAAASAETVLEVADAAPPEVQATPTARPTPYCVVPPLPPRPSTLVDFSPEEFERIRDQEDVDEALQRAHSFEDRAGYAVTKYLGGRAGEIGWKGEPPPEIAALAGTSPTCVTITLVPVPYSRADTMAAGVRVFEAGRDGQVPRPDGAGASAGHVGLDVAYWPVPEGAEADDLRRRLADIAGMPVTLVDMGGPVSTR